MHRHVIVRLLVITLPAAIAACSEQTPVALGTAPERIERAVVLAQPATGLYDLDFSWSGTELTLVAHVRDASGSAPDGGTVTFQYCSYGQPTNDITQPDEAPSSACADRDARWVTLARVPLNASGDAALPFGPVSVVTVIGFRIRYTAQGSGVENESVVEDWYRPL